MGNQTPGSIRIRTDDGNEWRLDAAERAARFYDRNRSDAIAFACDDVPQLVESAQAVLERDDLTIQQKQEIAETLSTRAVNFEIVDNVDVTTKAD